MKKKWDEPKINEINICETADTDWGDYLSGGMSGVNIVPDIPQPGQIPQPGKPGKPGKPWKPGNNGNHYGQNK